MRLILWHFDSYPTAPGVYLGVFPRLGHEIVWIENTTAQLAGVRGWREGGVDRWEVARRADAAGWRPLAVLRTRFYKFMGFLHKVRLLWRLAATRPDVLQVRQLTTEGFVAWLAARRFRVRFVFYFDYPNYEARLHEWNRARRPAPWGRLTARWWMAWRDFLLRRSDLTFPISPAMAERLASRLGLERSKMEAFPVGIERALWQELGATAPLSLEGLDGDRPIVAYMGSLEPIREPEFLLDVVDEILRCRRDAQFLLVAKLPAVLERRLAACADRDRVFVSGFRPRREALLLLKNADLGLFPLPVVDPLGVFYTSSPLKIVEYLSAGLPVVSSRNGDAEEVLQASGGGVIVENRIAHFAEASLALLGAPAKAREMGQRGRAYVAQHRTCEALAVRIEAAYNRLLRLEPEGPDRPAEGGSAPSAS